MTPLTLVLLLAAGILALIPVYRLHVAGWPRPWLTGTWVAFTAAFLLVLAFPAPARFLVPILVIAFIAPFVVAPERLTRILRGREPRGVVIDVTPLGLTGGAGMAGRPIDDEPDADVDGGPDDGPAPSAG